MSIDAGLASIGQVHKLRLLDYDRDERPDLLLTRGNAHALLRNSEKSRFERVALPSSPSLLAPTPASAEAVAGEDFVDGGSGMGIPLLRVAVEPIPARVERLVEERIKGTEELSDPAARTAGGERSHRGRVDLFRLRHRRPWRVLTASSTRTADHASWRPASRL